MRILKKLFGLVLTFCAAVVCMGNAAAFAQTSDFSCEYSVGEKDGKYIPWLLMGMTALSVAYLIFVH